MASSGSVGVEPAVLELFAVLSVLELFAVLSVLELFAVLSLLSVLELFAVLSVLEASPFVVGAAAGGGAEALAGDRASTSEAIGVATDVPVSEDGRGARVAKPADVTSTESLTDAAGPEEFVALAESIRGRNGDAAIIAASSAAKSLGTTSSR